MGQESIESKLFVSDLLQAFLRNGSINQGTRTVVIDHFQTGITELTKIREFLPATYALARTFPQIDLYLYNEIVSQIPLDTLDQSQREVLAIAALSAPLEIKAEGTSANDLPYVNGMKLSASVRNRSLFACPGDWITGAAEVVEAGGFDFEGLRKEEAILQGINLLNGKTRVSLSDIEDLYQQVFATVYPGAENVPNTFRAEEVSSVLKLRQVAELGRGYSIYWHYLIHEVSEAWQRRNALNDNYLNTHNTLLRQSQFYGLKEKIRKQIGNQYVYYSILHPHLDLNGTMSKALAGSVIQQAGGALPNWNYLRTTEGKI